VPTAAQHDSQGICFVPNGDYAAFIDAWFKDRGVPRQATQGEIVDTSGKVLAEHDGVHHYTVGQRKGLKVAVGEPLYVIATNPMTQQVVVGRNEDLLRPSLVAKDVNWVSIAPLTEPRNAQVKIRNRHAAAAATLTPTSDPSRVDILFETPQRAVTPGQAAVFYDDDVVLAGGWIE